MSLEVRMAHDAEAAPVQLVAGVVAGVLLVV